MAFIKDHEEDCVRFLGKPFTEVHRWLDQYAKFFPVGFFEGYHRSFLHNSYGLQCIQSLYGEEAEKAARIHLIRDYLECPIDKNKVNLYMDGKNFNIMMRGFNNPTDIAVHYSVAEAWIKEGFGLVCLAMRNIIYVTK